MKKFFVTMFYTGAIALLILVCYGAVQALATKQTFDSADYILFTLAGAIFVNIFKTFGE